MPNNKILILSSVSPFKVLAGETDKNKFLSWEKILLWPKLAASSLEEIIILENRPKPIIKQAMAV